MTKKIFLGGPFKSYVDHKTNKMHDAHIKRFHDLILFFEERGYEVHNAHQREDWEKISGVPMIVLNLIMKKLQSQTFSSLFQALLPLQVHTLR